MCPKGEKRMKKEELLKPRYDVVFQALFQGNQDNITESLISDILGEKVKIIDIKTDSNLIKRYPTDKAGRLDLKTKFEDGTICQIEMQMLDKHNTIKRILYYWSRSYSEQLKRGDIYGELKKTIGIIITNYEIEEMKGIEELDTKWQIIESKRGKRILTEDLELRIIEIPKAERILEKEIHNRIAQWLTFINNPNTERVEKIMKENEEVKKAKSVLHVMSKDEELKRLAELKEKWERDEKSAQAAWKEEGLEEGIEKGRKEGLIITAKNMKKNKFTTEQIAQITGLSKEEIEEIQENN